MSENVVMSRFCKSGDLHHLSRKFHNLTREQKKYAIEMIQHGETPEKALKLARIKHRICFENS